MNKEDYDLLIKAASNYYNGLDTGLSDEEYDKLFYTKKNEDPSFNIFECIKIDSDSLTVKHPYKFTPELFKKQFKTKDELFKILESDGVNNNNHHITYKFDGTSIRCIYSNGKLIDIITRSDEINGKRKLNMLRNKVPNSVPNNVVTIDFEAVCCKEDWGEDPRSKSNGLINSKYKSDEVDKFITLIPFKVTPKDTMDWLEAMRLVFDDNHICTLNCHYKEFSYDQRFVEWDNKHIPIDGLVYYTNTVDNHKIYKFYFNDKPTSVVTNIYWNFTDKLCWVPKVQFNTVKIDGRNVSQATSNGFARLKALKAGIGSTIEIILANSTIPQVHKVLVESENYNEPKVCPFCGSEIVNIGEKLRCSNQFCGNVINWITNRYAEKLGSDKRGMKSLNEIEEFIKEMKLIHTQDELLSKLGESLFIERFGKLAEVSRRFVSEKEKLFNGLKTMDLIGNLFTHNQYLIYGTYCELIDKMIYYIKE